MAGDFSPKPAGSVQARSRRLGLCSMVSRFALPRTFTTASQLVPVGRSSLAHRSTVSATSTASSPNSIAPCATTSRSRSPTSGLAQAFPSHGSGIAMHERLSRPRRPRSCKAVSYRLRFEVRPWKGRVNSLIPSRNKIALTDLDHSPPVGPHRGGHGASSRIRGETCLTVQH